MARQAREVEIDGGPFVTPGERATQVRTGEDTSVPSQVHAEIHLREPAVVVRMYILVDKGGRARVVEAGVAVRDIRKAVTNTALRGIPLDHLMRIALDKATIKGIKNRPDVHPDAFQLPGDPADVAWVGPRPAVTGRGREVPEERVAQAARIYLEALAQGSAAPGEAVAKALNYSRATAARDLRMARKRGLLPAAGQEASADKLTPPSSEAVADDPVMPRFDDPTRWARRSDVLSGPSGLPFYDPNAEGPAPEPVPGTGHPGITTPETWLQRIREAASIPLEARDTSLSPKEVEKIMKELAQAQEELQTRLRESPGQPQSDDDA